MRRAGFMTPGSMPTLAPADTRSWYVPHRAMHPHWGHRAPPHNTVPAQTLSPPGKHRKLAQVSYLASPHFLCPPAIHFWG